MIRALSENPDQCVLNRTQTLFTSGIGEVTLGQNALYLLFYIFIYHDTII